MFGSANRRFEGSYRSKTSEKSLGRARACRAASAAVALAICGAANLASAANFTWDSVPSGSPTNPLDGSGTWNNTLLDWSNGTSDTNWTNGTNIAIFGNGGTAGTVTQSGITAGGLYFNPVASGIYNITGGTLTLSGATPTITMNGSNAIISSTLTGSTGLVVAGTGTLILTTSPTYTNGTTINAGATLQIGLNGTSGNINSGATLLDNGTLAFSRTDTGAAINATSGLIVTGSGGISEVSSGELTINENLQNTGTLAVNSGTILITTAGNVNSSSGLLMGGGLLGGPTLNIATGRSSSVIFSASTFNYGTDQFAVGASLGSSGNTVSLGGITRNIGSVVNFGTLPTTGNITTTTANSNPTGAHQSIIGGYAIAGNSWAVSGTGATAGNITALPQSSMTSIGAAGPATLVANADILIRDSGANPVAANTTINSLYYLQGAPGLQINSGETLTIATGGILIGTNEGANTINLTGPGNITSGNGLDLIVTQDSGAGSTYNIGAVITNSGSTPIGLTLATINGGAPAFVLSATNTFTGDTNLDNGTTTLSSGLALQNSVLNYNGQGGTVSFGTLTAATLGGLRGTQNLAIPAALALTIGSAGQSANTIYAGVLSGTLSTGSLTKAGAGTLTLTGANTYTVGATKVTAGSLLIGPGGSLGNTPITVSSGATFGAVPGNSSVTAAGTLTLQSGSNFNMSGDSATGILNLTNSGTALTLAGATFSFDLSSSATDKLAVTHAASVSGTNIVYINPLGSSLSLSTYSLITAASGLTGTFEFSNAQTSENVTLGGTPYTLNLLNSSTSEQLSVTLAATSATWNGGATPGDSSWTNAANWNGSAPGATYSLIFDGSVGLTPNNNFAANTQFNGLKFTSTAGAFTLGGNAINLGGDVLNQSSNTQTINMNLALQQPTNFSAGTGSLVVGGAISGGFAVTTLGSTTSNSVTLSGSNSYTGNTSVNSGKLILSPTASLAVTAISVGTGAIFAPQPAMGSSILAGGSLALANGSTFDMSGDSSAGTFSLAGALGIGSATGTASSLKFDVGTNGGSTVTDLLAASGAATVTGTNSISVVGFGSSNLSAGTYNLITALSGLGSGFTLATPTVTVNGNTYNLSLINTAGAEELKIAAPTVFATWQATGPGTFSWGSPTTNWSSSPSVPSNPTDSATFGTSAGTNNQTITLDQPNYAVGVLVFNNTSETPGNGDYTIAGDGGSNTTLTLDNFLAAPTITNSNGNNTISANLSLNGSPTISVAGGTSLTASGTISNGVNGAAGITKTGAGTLVLSTSNSYTGGTNLSGGTLDINNASAPGTGAMIIGAGTTIDNTTGGGITLANNNAQTWNGSFTFTGTQSLNLGTGAVTLNTSPTVTVAANNLTVGGVVSGAYGITKAGAGTLTLTGSNSFSGGTTVSAGTLNINGDLALGAAPSSATTNLTFSGNSTLQAGASTVALNANRNVAIGGGVTATFDTNGNTINIPGVISGNTGAISKINSGTLILGGANTYGSGTTITGGTISISQPTGLGTGGLTLNSGTTFQIAPPGGSSVTGFGGSGAPGWRLQQGQDAAGPTVSSGNVLTLTNASNTFLNNAAWDLTKVVYSSSFTASFVYQITGGGASGNGATFTLENSTNTPNTGTNGVAGGFGTDLGYGHLQGQVDNVVSPSAALGWSTGGTSQIGPGANGVLGTFAATGGSVNLNSGDPILFTVSGTGNSNILSYTIKDQTTGNTTSNTVNLGAGNTLNALLGGSGSAYVGFTGGSTTPTASQTISNFTYASGFSGTFNATNPVTVNANSTIDVSYAGGATMGTLAIGGSTLNITNQLGTGGTLTMGATTLSGSPTFVPAANTTLALGALADGGTAQTITVAAASSTGAVTLAANAGSLSTGTTFAVTTGILNSNATTAMGSLPVVNLSNGTKFGIGASQTIASISDGGTLNSATVNLNGNILTIGGSNNLSSVFNGTIADGTGAAGTGGLTKAGSGTLTLNGSHTYSGATLISAGTLALTSTASLGNTAITVASSSIFAPVASTHAGTTGAGTAGATLTLQGGSILNLADGTIGNFNVNQQSSFGSGTALTLSGATLDFDLGGTSSTGTDTLAVNIGSASVSGTNTIALSLVPGTTTLATGSYNLITASGGLNSGGAGAFNLTSSSIVVGSTTYALSLGNSGSVETLLVSNNAASSAWTSGHGTNVWADAGNWSNGIPGAIGTTSNGNTVVFNANPGISTPMVDSGRNVQNITFDNTAATLGSLNLSGSALTLTSAGVIQTLSNVATNQMISAALVLEGSYSVLSNSGSNNTLSPGAISGVNSGTVLTLGGSSSGLNTISGAITDGSGSISLIKTGAGTWVLSSSANTFSGGINISQGLLSVATSATGSGNLQFSGGTLQYAAGNTDDLSALIKNSGSPISLDTNGNNVTFSGSVDSSNTGGLTKLGTGILTLAGGNGYSGSTTVNAGAINLTNSSGLGSTSNVTVASGAALQLTGSVSVGNVPLSLSGAGVTASPAGALESVNGNNTYSGTVTLAGSSTIGADAGSITLNASNSVTGSGTNLALAGAGNGTISGSITLGSGSVTQNSPGTWALSGSNTYTGGTTLNAGITQINTANSLGASSGLAAINSATLEATTSIAESRNFSLGSSSCTIQVDPGATYSLGGHISDGLSSGTLNKTGTGQLALSASSSFTGGTNISAGTISITHPQALGSGPVALTGSSPTLQINPFSAASSGFGGTSHTGWSFVVGAEPPFSQPAPSVTTTSGVDTLLLTTSNVSPNGSFENRAAWKTTPITYAAGFQAAFVYQNIGGSANGMTFTLQTTGTSGVVGGFGTALGYSGSTGQQDTVPAPSAAFAWQVNGQSTIGSGVNGTLGSFSSTGGGVNLATSDPFQFVISGTGTSNQFGYTITDEAHPADTTSGTLTLSGTLSALLANSGNAFVGFTGGSTAATSVSQSISNFSFTSGFAGNFAAGNAVNVSTNSTIDVSYNGGATLGALSIGSNTLTVTNNSGGGANLTMGATTVTGNPTFAPAAGVQVNLGALNDGGTPRAITVAAGASNGVVNLTSGASSFVGGSSVTVNSGTLLVSNGTSGSATGTGAVNVSSGASIGGTGTIAGVLTVNSGGTAFVGPTNNTPGKVAGVLNVGSGSSLLGSTLLDLTAPSTSDEVIAGGGTGSLTLGGNLVITVPNTFTYAGGQTYQLFGFGSESGTFSSISTLPTLSGGLSWVTSNLYSTGAISITAGGPSSLTWNNTGGAGNGTTWDTTQNNWNNGTGVVAYSDNSNSNISAGDIVAFTDTNNGNYSVSISSTVHPTSTAVTTNGAYTFNGSGGIAGPGSLTLSGSGSLTLNESNSYAGGTNVSGGTLILGVAGALPNGTNLTIGSGARVFANNLGSAVAFAVGSLSVAGKLDLNNNALVVHNSSIGAITALVQSGFNSGAWNGSTGIISTAATSDGSHLTALGVIQNSVDGTTTGTVLHSTFENQTGLAATDVLVKYTYYGDANLDGKVDGSDYSRIDSTFLTEQSSGPMSGWYNGDFNYDGVVDGSDYTLIDNAFNSQGSQIAAEIAAPTAEIAAQIAGGGASSAVPEPTTLGLLGIGALGLLGRRNRRRN